MLTTKAPERCPLPSLSSTTSKLALDRSQTKPRPLPPQFGLRFNMSSSPLEGSLGGLLPAVDLGIDSEVVAKPRPPGPQYAFLEPYTHVTRGPASSSQASHFDGPAHADAFFSRPEFDSHSNLDSHPDFDSRPLDFYANAFDGSLEEHLVPDFPDYEHQGHTLHSPGPSHSHAPPVRPYPSKKPPCRTRNPPPRFRRPPGLQPIPVPSSFRGNGPRQYRNTDCPPSRPSHRHQREGSAFPPTSSPHASNLDDLPHSIQDIKEILQDPSYQADYYRESFRTKQRPPLALPPEDDAPDDDVGAFLGSAGRAPDAFLSYSDSDVERLRAAILDRDQEFDKRVRSQLGNSPDADVARRRKRR